LTDGKICRPNGNVIYESLNSASAFGSGNCYSGFHFKALPSASMSRRKSEPSYQGSQVPRGTVAVALLGVILVTGVILIAAGML
jgi:hypothetical protein